MEQRALGRSGLKVSRLGLGTMTWGAGTDPDEAAAILVAFRDAGGTLVDTAASYSGGESERILGALMADVVPRSELVLASKAGISRSGDQRTVDASRGALLRPLDESLPTSAWTTWTCGRCTPSTQRCPPRRRCRRWTPRSRSGKVRYVGVSNYPGWRTAQAATWQRAVPGRAPLVSNQVRYSLLERGIEREVLPGLRRAGAGDPGRTRRCGGGVLTGKYRHGIPADSRGAAQGRNLASYSDARQVGIVEAVATAADGLATSPITVALAWLRNRPGVAAADRRRPHAGPADRRRAVAGGGAAAGDPAGAGRRVRAARSAIPRTSADRIVRRPARRAVFAAFCVAGLWPGLGSTLAAELAEAGITAPERVTAAAWPGCPRWAGCGPAGCSRRSSPPSRPTRWSSCCWPPSCRPGWPAGRSRPSAPARAGCCATTRGGCCS